MRLELTRRQFANPAQLLGLHPHKVEGERCARALEDIEPEPAPARRESVHDHDSAWQLIRRLDGRLWHAVLDDRGRRRSRVPHQVVEVRDVHEQQIGVRGRVPRVRRVLARRVVLEID